MLKQIKSKPQDKLKASYIVSMRVENIKAMNTSFYEFHFSWDKFGILKKIKKFRKYVWNYQRNSNLEHRHTIGYSW